VTPLSMTFAHRLCLSLLLAIGCDMADRDEQFRGRGPACGVDEAMDAGVANDSGDDNDGGGDSFTTQQLLVAAGQCAMTRYGEFATLMERLTVATQTHAQAPTTTTRDAAQTAFLNAMAAWQRAELFQFGPAARVGTPGGQDLRDEIYFFPAINRCLIDQQLVNQRYAQPAFGNALASSRGLAAIEYLLFFDGATNACSTSQSINTNGSWASLSATERTQRRADYAHAAATDVLVHAQALVNAWAASGGNYLRLFVGDGSNASCGAPVESLNALITAVLYVDEGLKDFKIALPLALALNGVIDCPNAPATCPERLESQFARTSIENIRQNLIGFRQLFQGCGTNYGGVGIDDWLRSIDQGGLADRILSALDHAEATAGALGSLEDAAVQMPPDGALELHAAIKALSDLLKTELVMVLNVQLPAGVGGDVD